MVGTESSTRARGGTVGTESSTNATSLEVTLYDAAGNGTAKRLTW